LIRDVLRHLVAAIGVLLVSLPLGAVLTLTLMPAWRWLEARYGIESVGHSGPAEWCYLVTFATCVLLIGTVYVRGVRAARANSPP
jgi:hypothetical protein